MLGFDSDRRPYYDRNSTTANTTDTTAPTGYQPLDISALYNYDFNVPLDFNAATVEFSKSPTAATNYESLDYGFRGEPTSGFSFGNYGDIQAGSQYTGWDPLSYTRYLYLPLQDQQIQYIYEDKGGDGGWNITDNDITLETPKGNFVVSDTYDIHPGMMSHEEIQSALDNEQKSEQKATNQDYSHFVEQNPHHQDSGGGGGHDDNSHGPGVDSTGSSGFGTGTDCLTEDMQVKLNGKIQPVTNVKVGDTIDNTKVVRVEHKHMREGYYIINNELKITNDHPVKVAGKWKKTEDVKVGDKINNIEVKSIRYIKQTTPTVSIDTKGEKYDVYAGGKKYSVHGDYREKEVPMLNNGGQIPPMYAADGATALYTEFQKKLKEAAMPMDYSEVSGYQPKGVLNEVQPGMLENLASGLKEGISGFTSDPVGSLGKVATVEGVKDFIGLGSKSNPVSFGASYALDKLLFRDEDNVNPNEPFNPSNPAGYNYSYSTDYIKPSDYDASAHPSFGNPQIKSTTNDTATAVMNAINEQIAAKNAPADPGYSYTAYEPTTENKYGYSYTPYEAPTYETMSDFIARDPGITTEFINKSSYEQPKVVVVGGGSPTTSSGGGEKGYTPGFDMGEMQAANEAYGGGSYTGSGDSDAAGGRAWFTGGQIPPIYAAAGFRAATSAISENITEEIKLPNHILNDSRIPESEKARYLEYLKSQQTNVGTDPVIDTFIPELVEEAQAVGTDPVIETFVPDQYKQPNVSGAAPADDPNTPQNEYLDFINSGQKDYGTGAGPGGPIGIPEDKTFNPQYPHIGGK
jgi:hypothetical protein